MNYVIITLVLASLNLSTTLLHGMEQELANPIPLADQIEVYFGSTGKMDRESLVCNESKDTYGWVQKVCLKCLSPMACDCIDAPYVPALLYRAECDIRYSNTYPCYSAWLSSQPIYERATAKRALVDECLLKIDSLTNQLNIFHGPFAENSNHFQQTYLKEEQARLQAIIDPISGPIATESKNITYKGPFMIDGSVCIYESIPETGILEYRLENKGRSTKRACAYTLENNNSHNPCLLGAFSPYPAFMNIILDNLGTLPRYKQANLTVFPNVLSLLKEKLNTIAGDDLADTCRWITYEKPIVSSYKNESILKEIHSLQLGGNSDLARYRSMYLHTENYSGSIKSKEIALNANFTLSCEMFGNACLYEKWQSSQINKWPLARINEPVELFLEEVEQTPFKDLPNLADVWDNTTISIFHNKHNGMPFTNAPHACLELRHSPTNIVTAYLWGKCNPFQNKSSYYFSRNDIRYPAVTVQPDDAILDYTVNAKTETLALIATKNIYLLNKVAQCIYNKPQKETPTIPLPENSIVRSGTWYENNMLALYLQPSRTFKNFCGFIAPALHIDTVSKKIASNWYCNPSALNPFALIRALCSTIHRRISYYIP